MNKKSADIEQKKSTERKRDFFGDARKKLEKKAKQSKGWAIAIKAAWVLGMLLWVAFVLFVVQYTLGETLKLFISVTTISLSSSVIHLLFSATLYVLSLVVIVFVPWKLMNSKTTRDELGLRGLPTWTDILLAPIGFFVFMIVAMILLMVFQNALPGIDWSEKQDVGFSNLLTHSDFLMAFLCLVVIGPIAEEIIFRGWLYGKLRRWIPAIPAILAVSVLFGYVHLQWNVGVTVFVMSIAMCLIREITGTIWGGILIHIIKNGIAFYFLFVNPVML